MTDVRLNELERTGGDNVRELVEEVRRLQAEVERLRAESQGFQGAFVTSVMKTFGL